MRAFSYVRVEGVQDTLAALRQPGVKLLAGGTNLLDLMKGDIEQPAVLVDITRLPLRDIAELPDGGVRIGALARNSDTANHPLIRQRYPLLTQALVAGASPQLRNMATVGGNLLQRTRCHYFVDAAYAACNKRKPGSGCAARDGFTRQHAIFGASPQCIATHPSDMAVALAALDATVQVQGPRGGRRIALRDFHRLPGANPERDTTLAGDELIVAVDLPASRFAEHSHYLKVRDRASYEFALTSAAVALDVQQGSIRHARVALGGVATMPWPSSEAINALNGKPANDETFKAAADAAMAGAKPQKHNAFKIELAKRTIVRALQTVAAMA